MSAPASTEDFPPRAGGVAFENRVIGEDAPVFVIAELSANHGGDFTRAKRLIAAAASAGADAVKFQTYTPEGMTLDSDAEWFRVGSGTIWEGRTLHDLYREAMTPWEWQPELARVARDEGLLWFSSPFDFEAVEFLEALDPPGYKIASFELVDLPLIERVAQTGKPVVMSTGMASEDEIDLAVRCAVDAGASGVVLLRCNSAYPAPSDEMDLRTIPDMYARWGRPVGLSDHTRDEVSAVTAVALGACAVEKHIILSRSDGGPDAAFSAEPEEFRRLVQAVSAARQALGSVRYGPSPAEAPSMIFRRSLWVVDSVRAGESFTAQNVRALRPGQGMSPGDRARVLGCRARVDIKAGTPLTPDLVEGWS